MYTPIRQAVAETTMKSLNIITNNQRPIYLGTTIGFLLGLLAYIHRFPQLGLLLATPVTGLFWFQTFGPQLYLTLNRRFHNRPCYDAVYITTLSLAGPTLIGPILSLSGLMSAGTAFELFNMIPGFLGSLMAIQGC